ncbi:glycosyltransferase family 2 protein [Lacticaseibacillus zeae]|uniref:Glycosyltransferase family 2 protein n=1 Tax=Lacticaseibacillus zeae subsp. silagei TaxID=3068307 RepID=A0ABD7ZAA4_LACZE|nr:MULTISPECIES: glycosyltransferase family 2 protein [Lacticaseibacillus]MDE3316433.1 glycosyltransferase family 2 protein [Lacticaseibacillus zeae]OFR91636.1 glycosyl transferase family 2 [Lactobacillus sp. HMSC068F07]WLV83954.1 glycosyltransferase family 2 protein [Lacticaseibacillus sp. NCIMB 15475]WLV86710.1 glycosyltransferase family 2 protein [Lacticaseibacillus sp. NCIMB 15474]
MTTPLVTIIVPVYNLEAYVAHGLQSLLAQTYSHLQIIVIDDASDDRSPQIVSHFARLDNRIHAILKSVNQGVSAARNSGLAQARGELVAFMDGDDWYEPDFIAHAVKMMNQGWDLIAMPFFRDDPAPRPVRPGLRKAKQLTRDGLIRQMLHPVGYIRGYLWNKVFRRDVIERMQLRFDEQMSIMEDELFTATYVMATHHFLYTGHPAYHHVVRRDSATQSLGVFGAIPQQLYALWRIHRVLRHARRRAKANKKETVKIDH